MSREPPVAEDFDSANASALPSVGILGLLAGSLAYTSLAQEAGAQRREESVEAPVVQGIQIDCVLDDWPAAMPRHPIGKVLTDDPTDRLGYKALEGENLSTSPDLSATFSVGYDPNEQVLYLAVIVRDDKLIIGHTSHLDTVALEVFIDGLPTNRSLPFPGNGAYDRLQLADVPVQQYIAIPGTGKIYGRPQDTNPILMFGDLKKTRTRMAYRRKGDVTTYQWAIQVFDRYPEAPTRLEPGKRIGFDLAIADKDAPSSTPEGFHDPGEDRTVWI